MASPSFTWGCEKWADCSCCASADKCSCGAGCGCGTVTIGDVNNAIGTQCDKSDCKCGMGCRCGKGNCKCGGSTTKTQKQWVEFTKALKNPAGVTCACNKGPDGTCVCASGCSCVPAS